MEKQEVVPLKKIFKKIKKKKRKEKKKEEKVGHHTLATSKHVTQLGIGILTPNPRN